jgi:hypothetical protein
LTFDKRRVGTTSAAQTVTFTNSGSAPLAITAVTVQGDHPGDYTGLTENCAGTVLDHGDSCSAHVAFRPTVTGYRTATLTIADNAPRAPHHVALRGTGT